MDFSLNNGAQVGFILFFVLFKNICNEQTLLKEETLKMLKYNMIKKV